MHHFSNVSQVAWFCYYFPRLRCCRLSSCPVTRFRLPRLLDLAMEQLIYFVG
ncbi:hypothetical protein BGZ61DRAFT_461297 [Ilyonectria robusta]|uniref:uncharacterized protein n=1 Tax=Ilyonectria robusta TaxID=1079257 RepID=UPI001E8DEDE0|nr:uncharacterized protein BGZ61DRAFT_461297 [Ilyonectria robusta]KAH8667145.1 hypothetical protein BGZ61DRAFT_461297 [Ilyonectria robusta]